MDQGTNFTARLMKLFHKQLRILAIKTTPYHPQTDGVVERFNQTLKRMLQKFVDDKGKDWDRWLPFLLFAYREVPQASTGFFPLRVALRVGRPGSLGPAQKGLRGPFQLSERPEHGAVCAGNEEPTGCLSGGSRVQPAGGSEETKDMV